ncbi:MAG TPA: Si-specific NAD(P)(+) transhydrogenase [Steroidobacteraceae bacterium]|jgi:NAD(P) transhydrogenase|nr:Si-specific NAD(P)(+) transhydrogenase [Steroidobacteraceae bacterium]
MQSTEFDLICLGSGPAGQKAAIQAAKAGFRACIVERETLVGGSCLLSGTIPSKALREQALRYRRMQGSASSLAVELRGDAPLSALLHGVDVVIEAQDKFLHAQLKRNGVELIRGKGIFLDAHRIEVQHLDGSRQLLHAPKVVLASGSRPRHVAAIEVDHEHIVDSDSILSLPYIPRSMLVLGSGVIACEYASIFAALGCTVTMLDKAAEPLGFLDPALRAGFLAAFRAMGGEYCGGSEVSGARFDGFSQVEVQLRGGETLASDIVFAAFGRVANLEGIGLDRLGLGLSSRGTVEVNERFETNIPGLFAAGDAIGPPALACAAADQGRRAALAALGLPPPALTSLVPSGVYTIPEIACVGLSRTEAAAKKIDVIVGRADFAEVARAHIAGEPTGFLTLLCEPGSARVLGVQVLGEGATELVHLGQAAIATGASADFFIEQIFNFPTMTEAYRIAAFDILKQRSVASAKPLKLAGAAR